MNQSNYKKIYTENMNGLKWDSNLFEIHHIDLNHNNNDFDNLVLLPKKLHKSFHVAYAHINTLSDKFDIASPKPDWYEELCLFDYYFSDFWKLKLEMSWFWTLKKYCENKEFPVGLNPEDKDFCKYIKAFSLNMYKKYCEQ